MGLLRANAHFVRFLLTSARTAPYASTACDGWTAHDLVSHVAAGSAELADLIALALRGRTRATRPFREREEPYRAMSHLRLHAALVAQGVRLSWLLQRLARARTTIAFTGTTLTAGEIVRHAESELVLHRYDLVGLDRIARRGLSSAALVAHAHGVVTRMDAGVLPPPSESPVELLAVWGR
jgi:hypothetical protein